MEKSVENLEVALHEAMSVIASLRDRIGKDAETIAILQYRLNVLASQPSTKEEKPKK